MTLEQAMQNLYNLQATSRLTEQERLVLQQSLQLLYETAVAVKKSESEPKASE